VPDIPLEVINRIQKAGEKNKADIVVVEIGGTAGEYQNVLFLEAVRILQTKKPKDIVLVLVSLIPALGAGGTELKTKPTQYAARTLNSAGLRVDLIMGRAPVPLDEKRKEKIAFVCGLASKDDVISAPDAESIYEVPVNFEDGNLADRLLEKLGLKSKKRDMKEWRELVHTIRNTTKEVRIAVVGKYFGTGNFMLTDSYISVIEAVKHGSYFWKRKPVLEWIDSEKFEKNPAALKELSKYDGIIVPGGFGARGVEGIIKAIGYARKNRIPYLGLCYGMQLAVVEFARNVAGLKKAHTTEIDASCPEPVIDIMPEQKKNLMEKNFGATMRLGAYPAALADGTIAFSAYGQHLISERHRHRFEVNPAYIDKIREKGGVFSGFSPDKRLMEIFELPREVHPFFMGSQFHPEFKSRPLSPHPLFREFIKAAISPKKGIISKVLTRKTAIIPK
jgi:CTP synthase